MDEWVERVDEQDQASAVVLRGEAVRLGLLHRVAVTVCRDRDGRILVHRRSERLSRFPGHYEVGVGGAVTAGESYEEAAIRELAEELGVRASVRFVTKFLNRSGLSPHWLGIHEAVIPVEVSPDHNEVVWHAWLAESELLRFMDQQLFTPDSGRVVDRYFTGVRPGPPTTGPAPRRPLS
ncbi:NUDIX domain-containing protein [Streptomyces sp. AF1A]|jgi:8-oxo-dGTP pyrophosphatase MutT (NUDIX family)|uniref:NUDIX domain-containing protein n=1 Tax=Streptomyces sp. AF1A TaxID=3394350 RepID=UPI0039BCD42D